MAEARQGAAAAAGQRREAALPARSGRGRWPVAYRSATSSTCRMAALETWQARMRARMRRGPTLLMPATGWISRRTSSVCSCMLGAPTIRGKSPCEGGQSVICFYAARGVGRRPGGGEGCIRGGITVNSSHVVFKWDIMFAMGLL